MLLSELAGRLGASVVPPAPSLPSTTAVVDPDILGVATLAAAQAHHISFLTNVKFADQLATTHAAAVLVKAASPDVKCIQLVHANPYAAMAKASQIFWKGPVHHQTGQSELAFVHATARIHPLAILYPFCYIDANAQIDEGAVIYPGVYVGAGAEIGARTILYPSVTVMHACRIAADVTIHASTVVGADGFGFAPTREGIEKIPQIGGVDIGPECEIGAACTIDRGAFGDTVLARGCKLDAQVHIAHGVEVGEFGILCGQTAIAGSTKVGRRVVLAGHAAIGPSIEVGDHVTLGAKAGMIRSTAEAGEYQGMPAMPARDWRRQVVAMKELPDLMRKMRDMARRIDELEKALGAAAPVADKA